MEKVNGGEGKRNGEKKGRFKREGQKGNKKKKKENNE